MRREFFKLLYELMKKDPKVIALTGDLGYGGFDLIRKDLPKQFINVGASEQTLLDMAVGLAMSDYIPVCYSITPFLVWRAAETIRLYINHEDIPVKLIGCGRDYDYKEDGVSHWANDVPELMNQLLNVEQYWPKDGDMTANYLDEIIYNNRPSFLSLKRN